MFREVERYAIWIIAVLMIVMSLGMVDAQQKLTGLIVEEAPTDSPAAKAGLKVGDRILTYDEKALSSPPALRSVEENTFGKKEVTLVIRRAEQTLTLAVIPGSLGIRARPELPSAVLQLYEEGKAALQAKKVEEAIGRWNAAAKAAQEAGEQTAAAWLHGRIGETYEGQRQWQAAIEAHTAAWEILKQGGDESTTVFMSAFYRALRKGTSKDQALQQAMAAVRRTPQWRHPFYWSPFVLVGSWR
jgi:tetratricopeptide (TPR) repeat protein